MKRKLRPYSKWSTDEHSRWIDCAHTFGIHLMQAARDEAISAIPADATERERQLATKAAFDALYGVAQLLDGVADSDIDDDHRIEYALHARVRDSEWNEIESIELDPDGDGICMGIHGWWKDEYWPK